MSAIDELAVSSGKMAAAMKRAEWAVVKAQEQMDIATAGLAHAIECRDKLVASYEAGIDELKAAAKAEP
jgi:ribosome-binding protein aMBF1 (putative translation factor)